MRLVMVALMLVLPGLLASATVLGQQPITESGKRLRVTTIRIDRSDRFNTARHPVVQAAELPSYTPMAEQNHASPKSVLVAHPVVASLPDIQPQDVAGQVGYQQERADLQGSPSDYPVDREERFADPAERNQVAVDSRYESLDYYDPQYPTSEYQFIGGDMPQPQDIRTPIGFCEYRHRNNPFHAYYQTCGGSTGCCDEWTDFCPCFGLSRFRYFCKKDCFYGKTGCRARHAYRHGKWVHDDDDNGQCLDCNVR